MLQTFQLRSVGTQAIKLKATMPAADAHVIARNYKRVFCLSGFTLTVRPDGRFDVQVTLEPDNGMMTVEDSPPPSKHHSPDEEHAEPEQNKDNPDTIDA